MRGFTRARARTHAHARMHTHARTPLPPLQQVKIGQILHVPASHFPDEVAPACGYWVGTAIKTPDGGTGDVGIFVEGEGDNADEIFTQPHAVAAWWVVGHV